jgi:hypothetical protein
MSRESVRRPSRSYARISACRKLNAMLSTTVYLHPRRTLTATWDLEPEVPCLVAYREHDPSAKLDLVMPADHPSSVVVACGHWFVHGYPSSSAANGLRRDFELAEVCGRDASIGAEMECHCESPSGLTWNSLVVVAPDRLDLRGHDIPTGSGPMSDLSVDIRLALLCTPPQIHPWVLCGRRGSRFIAVVISPDHSPSVILAQERDQDAPFERTVVSALESIRTRFELDIRHIMLFGDYLTLPMIDELKVALRQSGIKSTRLQPFRAVDSALDASTSDRILSRAHVIAPIMSAAIARLML